MTCSRCIGWVLGAVVGLLLAAALCCPVEAGAVTYYGDYFDFVAVDQCVAVSRNDSAIATGVASAWSCVVYYDYDYELSGYSQLGIADNYTNYDLNATFPMNAGIRTLSVPLPREWSIFYFVVTETRSGNSYRSEAVIMNTAAEVIVSNEEPTPVRIQEIGLASEASTLAPDILPTSLDASVSVDGTLPVDVVSFLGEDDGPFLWAIVGGLVGIGAFVLVRRVANV